VQEQVAATHLDPRNMPDLNCISLAQHDQACALMRAMVMTVIDEFKNSDASTDINDSIEDVTDFLVTASADVPVNSLDLSSAEIADREIENTEDSHRSLSQGQESSRRVASRCCASFPLVGCLVEACTCHSCNFSISRALIFHDR